MNKLLVGVSVGFLFTFSTVYVTQSYAMQKQGVFGERMHHRGMMHGMMSREMGQECMRMMPGIEIESDLKAEVYLREAKELGLSQEQIVSLRRIILQAQKDLTKKQAEKKVAEIELKELLERGAKLNLVESKLKEIANIEVALKLTRIKADLETEKLLASER